VTDPQQLVTELLPDLGAFSFRAGSFFQNNSSILPAFVRHVVFAALEGSPEVLVDLYCGVGLFAISAAKHFQRIFGVEVDAGAVSLARQNAAAHDAEGLHFLAADAAVGLRQIALALQPGQKIVVVVDPPRQGLKEEAREALLRLQPWRIVYVSCDCATQARDLKDFVAEGYVVKRATPFDLFPQTRHLEVVVELERE
ncbi:tRNA (uracil(54)-C(5))-methyltransferase (Transfer RNA methyltransferase 2) (tRNA(m5U54)-methyltransferase), partial [Durusdinium trenchii]